MPVINLDESMRKADESEFWAVRGKAIQTYANLEQALCMLFALTSGTPFDIAKIIFFKITSADTRYKIIEKLFRKKFENKYIPFIKSLIKQLKPITTERNEIVHWSVWNTVGADENGETTANLHLRQQTAENFNFDKSAKGTSDIIKFSKKCDFYSFICKNFYFIMSDRAINMPDAEKSMWLDIFEKPLKYPPSDELTSCFKGRFDDL